MMIKIFDESVEINHNLNWSSISDHLYRILILGGSVSGKTNVLLNLTNYQPTDIDKIYLYFKDSFESKYQLLINWREKAWVKQFNLSKALINYSQTIDNIYQNLEDPTNKIKVLIAFDDIIANTETNKKLNHISLKGPLNVLTSGTCREPAVDLQGTLRGTLQTLII